MLAAATERIAWALDRPYRSEWLKQVLRASDGLDPIALQNDLEILRHLIMPRTQAQNELAKTSKSMD